MSRRRHPVESKILDAPRISRRVRLGWLQLVGLLFFIVLLTLAATGAFGGAEFAGRARESIWRVTFVYFFLVLAFRLTGKREVGQMSPLELMTLMMIPEIFSVALNRN